MQPFGTPVVPEVNAIRQTSSLEVSQAVNGAVFARIRASSPSGASVPQQWIAAAARGPPAA